MDNQQLFDFYNWSTIITSAILVLGYSLSLHTIMKDTNVGFVVTITSLLIISNLGAIGIIWANIVLTKHNVDHTPTPLSWLYFQSITGFLRDGCFNVGTWMFAYEYYNSAISMQYIFAQTEMPDERKQRLTLMNKILFAANVAVPVIYYFTLCDTNIIGTRSGEDPIFYGGTWFWVYTVSHYSVGGLQLLSGMFLLASVYIIRSFLVSQGLSDQVNYKAMIIHSVAFSAYNLAIIVYYMELYVYDSGGQTTEAIHNGLLAWSFVTYTNFLSQACLIWIFLQFRSRSEKQVTP